MQPRELALKILHEIDDKKAYVNISFQNKTEASGLSTRDIALVKELVYGVIKWQLTLDYVIQNFSSVKMKKISPHILCILRMGLYQIYFTDKIPASAAVNESVKLARKYGHSSSAGFVNALLRRATKEEIKYPDGDSCETLSVRYSHPLPLVNWLAETFGKSKAETILKENNRVPALCLRVNALKANREALIQKLSEEGISCHVAPYCDSALIAEGGNLTSSYAYREGFFTIQDQSAQLAAFALDPKPGQRVFDLCAAPGGKTTHLAELMENKGEILALDIYEKRLRSVTTAANRLGIQIITTQAADASTFQPTAMADKILVDAPCSGLGVIRRRPDIKYKAKLTDFGELTRIQLAILKQAGKHLKPGGELVYSTCTINPEENEKLVQRFLTEEQDFVLTKIKSSHLTERVLSVLENGMGTFYPEDDGGDGFFIAKLTRRNHG